MNCPHCNKDIKIRDFLSYSEFVCPSCQNQVFRGINQFIAVIGIILTIIVGYEKGCVYFVESTYLLPVYSIVSVLFVIALAFRLRKKPGVFHLAEAGTANKVYFASSFFLATSIIVLACMTYFDMIPALNDLTRIEGIILSNERKGNGRHLELMATSSKVFYLTPDDMLTARCPDINHLEKNSPVKLLVDPKPNILNYYRVWQIESNGKVICPYDIISDIRKSEVKDEIIIYQYAAELALLVYFISLHFKRKEDDIIKPPSSERVIGMRKIPEWERLTWRNCIVFFFCAAILLAVHIKFPGFFKILFTYGEGALILVFLIILFFKRERS